MEPLTLAAAIFTWALWVAIEQIVENAADAAWEGAAGQLKARFLRWAGKDKQAQRQAAFFKAAEIAHTNTLRYAADPQQTEKILDALNSERDKSGAEALAEEGAKLMLFSAVPDVPRLTTLCQERLKWDALWAGETPPPSETVATALSDFLANLKEAMLDQEPYHDLIQREMLRAMREVVAELRPVAYDDEATYRYQVAEMYRQLEFVGIPELKERRPITVEDIFIHLQAEREIEAPEVLEQAEPLWVAFSRDKSGAIRVEIPKKRVDVDEVLRETGRLVILGDPGAGKTTLLKYLTVICAEGRGETELGLKADGAGSPLPVFVPLREFAAECTGRGQDYCLLDYLYTHAREHLLLNLPGGFFEKALEAGRCLICLDGLDEVWAVGQRKAVSDAAKALAARYPRNRYLVTSRIVGYEEAPLDRRDFTHHTVLPLEDDDIREFVRKWYAVRERDLVRRKQKTDDLITTIERETRIKSLAQNPLLLTIIALVHRIEAELPHERVKLYDKCVTALVDTWEEVKGLTIAEKQRPFYRYRRRLLERLAYELHTRAEEPGQLRTVKAGDLELLLTRFLMENRRLGLADDPDDAREEAQAFVRLARGRTGLLVERGEGVFGFPHLTFQEYLAACDIENRCIHRGVEAIWDDIKGHLYDSHWREVILLLLGSLSKYDEPPTLLVERILETGKGDRFEPVLHRHLYLAARALADRVDVADDLHRRIVTAMLEITRLAPSWERGDAFAALSRLKQDDYAAIGLLALAGDDQLDASVRRAAASALGQLGRSEEAADLLLALAGDDQVDVSVRGDATAALGQLGRSKQATEILLALARDPQTDSDTRVLCGMFLLQLARIEDKALDGFLRLTRELWPDHFMRIMYASLLGAWAQDDDKVLDGFLGLVRDVQVDDATGMVCATALGLAQVGASGLNALTTLAHDDQTHAGVRRAAASALGQLGRTEEAAEILLVLAGDDQMDAWVRSEAAAALGQLGHTEDKVLDGLLALAGDEQVAASVRRAAASTLGQLDRTEEATDLLLALAGDDQVAAWVRCDAASALGQLGCTEEAADLLLALAGDDQVDASVRGVAASALGQLGRTEDKVLDGLLALAGDDQVDAVVRGVAASALGQLGRTEDKVLDGLLALAGDDQVAASVRRDAASALGQLGRTEEAADLLLALAGDDQVAASVRRDAASALGQLGCTEDNVLDGLLALVGDDQVDALVGGAVHQSLKQLVGGAVD